MYVLFIEGINQSGKSSVVSVLTSWCVEQKVPIISVKLPDYGTSIGRYIRDSFLAGIEHRPTSLKQSISAPISLYSLNRLEVLFHIREARKQIGDDGLILFDRSPFSGFFSEIDCLFHGDKEKIVDITSKESEAIKYLLERIHSSMGVGITRDSSWAKAVHDIMIEAYNRIYSIERLFFSELLGEKSSVAFLDVPVGVAHSTQAHVEESGKAIDVQESFIVQVLARELYLSCIRESELTGKPKFVFFDQMFGDRRYLVVELCRQIWEYYDIGRLVVGEGARTIRLVQSPGDVDWQGAEDLETSFHTLLLSDGLCDVRRELGMVMDHQEVGF